jgi:hypothetical protein
MSGTSWERPEQPPVVASRLQSELRGGERANRLIDLKAIVPILIVAAAVGVLAAATLALVGVGCPYRTQVGESSSVDK